MRVRSIRLAVQRSRVRRLPDGKTGDRVEENLLRSTRFEGRASHPWLFAGRRNRAGGLERVDNRWGSKPRTAILFRYTNFCEYDLQQSGLGFENLQPRERHQACRREGRF